MKLSFALLAFCTSVTVALAQHEPQLAPQSVQQAPQGRSAPLLGVRYSASTDVSHSSFNSPLVTYGDSLNEIQLPAAPIRPANLRQAAQEEDNSSSGESQEEQGQTLVRSGTRAQNQLQAQQVEPQNQVTQAIQPQSNTNQQFISVQQYPASARLQSTPQSFSLTQDLPGPQPQVATRYAAQYSPQIRQQIQQPQYATSVPQQYTVAQQPHIQQPQYATSVPPQQYTVAQQPQPLNYAQPQYESPAAYSSPSSNAYFATGPFAAQYPASNLIARQYPAQLPIQPVAAQYAQPAATQYTQPIAPQYAQPAQPVPVQYTQQYAQPLQTQYAQPVAQLASQYAPQSAASDSYPSTPGPFVSRVSFSGPVGGFSYGF